MRLNYCLSMVLLCTVLFGQAQVANNYAVEVQSLIKER